MAHVTTKTLRGVEVEIHADKRGTWSVLLRGETAKLGVGDTLEQAERQAASEIGKRRVKVSVPFITTAGEHGVATGLHVGNGNVVATIGGQSQQLTYSDVRALSPDMPAEELERMLKLQDDARRFEKEARELRARYEINVANLVKRAVDAARSETSHA